MRGTVERPGGDTVSQVQVLLVETKQTAVTDENGVVEKVGPGQGLVLPTGWNGTLAVPEGGVRKIWVTYMGDKK